MNNIISFKTKFGWIYASEKNCFILSISFGKKKNQGSSKTLTNLKNQIKNYFLGKNINYKFKIQLNGTKLQKKIWKQLQKIPYGETRSYKEIAKIIKTSPRYVGNVCGQNKHLLIIPCHRVIRSDGNLGGFSGTGGIKLKERLIKLEK